MDSLLLNLFKKTVALDASDLHFKSNMPVIVRIGGQLKAFDKTITSSEDIEGYIKSLLNQTQYASFCNNDEVDFSFSVEGLRFRGNAYKDLNGNNLSIRSINLSLQDFNTLRIPSILQQFCMKNQGLVLITGPTGSGKTTTLNSAINFINEKRRMHILTVEDPIEYVHENKNCIVTQREVGTTTNSFSSALRNALREDPDVIVVGEMRDLETMRTALTAAETGHLVFSTLHTMGADNSLDRIIDSFPGDEKEQIRVQLSMVLLGVISQQLVPRSDQPGRVLTTEVLTATSNVKSLIRRGATHMLRNTMQTSKNYGMNTMDADLEELCARGLVTKEIVTIYSSQLINK
ncbi:MAG: PilT/PilU family type 4a pilus ATPase [Clostridia bacterium]